MKKIILGAVMIIALVSLTVVPVWAAFYTGTPSPSLSPVFGTLVNFDDKATGTMVAPNDYVSVGVASITETEGLGTFARYPGSQSQPNYIGTGDDGERGTDADDGWDGTIVIELEYPTNQIGIGVADSGGGPEVVTIYDSAMSQLEQNTVPAGLNVYVYFSRTSNDIKYLKITGDFFAIDDLQFNPIINVEIDIKPGSDPNSINLKSKGVVPVAILTTDDFDASTVDPSTVVFAGAMPLRWTMEDVDGDGDLDMLFHFKTQELVLTIVSTEATLTGETFGGAAIEGTDSVKIPRGSKKGSK